jgi:hypothetical protein
MQLIFDTASYSADHVVLFTQGLLFRWKGKQIECYIQAVIDAMFDSVLIVNGLHVNSLVYLRAEVDVLRHVGQLAFH